MLLGEKADVALARRLSTDTRVSADTPPTFLFHTNADTAVPVENSIHYFLALRKAGVPAEMHIFKDGAHGAGMPMNDAALVRVAKSARELDARERISVTGQAIQKSVATPSDFR